MLGAEGHLHGDEDSRIVPYEQYQFLWRGEMGPVCMEQQDGG